MSEKLKNQYCPEGVNEKAAILVNYTGRKGGGAVCAYEMTKALLEKKENVVAVVSESLEGIEEWRRLPLKQLIVIPTYNGKISFIINSLFFFRQKRVIKKGLKDIVVRCVYCPMDTLWAHKVNKCIKNCKKIMVIHDPKPHQGASIIENMIFAFHAKKSDVLLVHTKKFIKDVIDMYKKPTYYIPMGRHNSYANCESKINLVSYEEDKINFLFFGRITPYKGLDVLAKAYDIVSQKQGDKVTLTVCGNGDFSLYEKLYSELKNVRIINKWICDEEVESIFTGKNIILLCPYKDATQSGVVLVAFDYGVPVIATRTGGLEEQVIDGKTGYLVEADNIDAFSDAMLNLVENEEIRKEMSANAYMAIKELDWSYSADMLIDIINQE